MLKLEIIVKTVAGRKVLFDVDSQTNGEIVERLVRTVGKTKEMLEEEALASEKRDNPANFGKGGDSIALKKGPEKGPEKGPRVNLLQAHA